MEINKLNEINNTLSSKTPEQKEKLSDVQERESAGDEELRKASNAMDTYGRIGVNILFKGNIKDTTDVNPVGIDLTSPSEIISALRKTYNAEAISFTELITSCKNADGTYNIEKLNKAFELSKLSFNKDNSKPAEKYTANDVRKLINTDIQPDELKQLNKAGISLQDGGILLSHYSKEERDDVIKLAEKIASDDRITDSTSEGNIKKCKSIDYLLHTAKDSDGKINLQEIEKIIDLVTQDSDIDISELNYILEASKNAEGKSDINTTKKVKTILDEIIDGKISEPSKKNGYGIISILHNLNKDYSIYNKALDTIIENAQKQNAPMYGSLNITAGYIEAFKNSPETVNKFLDNSEDTVKYLVNNVSRIIDKENGQIKSSKIKENLDKFGSSIIPQSYTNLRDLLIEKFGSNNIIINHVNSKNISFVNDIVSVNGIDEANAGTMICELKSVEDPELRSVAIETLKGDALKKEDGTFDYCSLRGFCNVLKYYPDLAKTLSEKKFSYYAMDTYGNSGTLDSFFKGDDWFSKPLTDEQTDFVCKLSQILAKNNKKITMFNLDDLNKAIVELKPEDMKLALEFFEKTNTLSGDDTDNKIMNVIKTAKNNPETIPETIEVLDKYKEQVTEKQINGESVLGNTSKFRAFMETPEITELATKDFEMVLKSNCSVDEAKQISAILKRCPDITNYYNIEELTKNINKINILTTNPELFQSIVKEGSSDLQFIMELDDKTLSDSLSSVENVSDEVKEKFPTALSLIYILTLVKKSMAPNMMNSDELVKMFNILLKYDSKTSEIIKDVVVDYALFINSINEEVMDIIAKSVEETGQIKDKMYTAKILNLGNNFSTSKKTFDEIVGNKDKLLKAVQVKCKDVDPEFTKKVEEYLNSDNAKNLLFLTDLSFDSLVNTLFEVAKLRHYVDLKPQDYINGTFDDQVIEGLKDFRKAGSDKSKYSSLSEKDTQEVQRLNNNIESNLSLETLMDAVSATDIETVKLLLDKRLNIFSEKIQEICSLSFADKEILSDFIRNGKRINKKGQPDKLTGQQKMDLIHTVKNAKSCIKNFNIDDYKIPLEGKAFILDFDKLHNDTLQSVLKRAGLKSEYLDNADPEKLKWNEKYLSLLAFSVPRDRGEIATVVREATIGDFKTFITDESKEYGQTNKRTQKAFEENNLDYEQWLNPDIEDVVSETAGKKFTIKMWDRNPQEDLFMGSKTSCCTALDGVNGGATAVYLLNTSYNVIQMFDSKGNVVGMSRVFMTKVDGKPVLSMDNIELNNEFTKDMIDTDKKQLRDKFFEYMNKYAEKVTHDPQAQVQFYAHDVHVPTYDLGDVQAKETHFVGDVSRDDLYVNAAGCSWIDPKKLHEYSGGIEWLNVPRQ